MKHFVIVMVIIIAVSCANVYNGYYLSDDSYDMMIDLFFNIDISENI